MKKLLQSLSTGDIILVETPVPQIGTDQILIETRASLVSAGTERMLLNFGKGNLVQKALQQPEKVKQVLQKAKMDGVASTLDAVRSKLAQPIPLGYCSSGIVRAVGKNVKGLKVGDRVASNGSHAELNILGENLIAKIPDNVSFEQAAFTPLGAIALQSLRLAKPTFGETFCVMGLGLVGLMAVQLLRASGCHVIGADFSKERLKLAAKWGAETVNVGAGEDPVKTALSMSAGKGIDGVIIAAATDSQGPIRQAPQMCRRRGRVILVGVSGLNMVREDWYEKEISFQVSCSYGPGRYDASYEEDGQDYPYGLVRWTEQRNFMAILEAISSGQLDVDSLISSSEEFENATNIYAKLIDQSDNSLGLVLTYPEGKVDLTQTDVVLNPARPEAGSATVAVIGAGAFGGRITLPALKAAGARIKTIVSKSGLSGTMEGKRAGVEISSVDFNAALSDPDIDSVIITTRHDTHGWMTVKAIEAGKHVFVEKPLALSHDDIDKIKAALASQAEAGTPRHLMVGFNRRFSPFSVAFKTHLDSQADPKCLIATINAGSIPADHWVHHATQGGGRIVGEGCHMIDLMRYFIGEPISEMSVSSIGRPASDGTADDKATITLNFEDGSIGTLHYFANGPASLSKERYEAFVGGKYLLLDNFKSLKGMGFSKSVKMKGRQDKGHAAALEAFIKAVQTGGETPISVAETLEVGRLSIDAQAQL